MSSVFSKVCHLYQAVRLVIIKDRPFQEGFRDLHNHVPLILKRPLTRCLEFNVHLDIGAFLIDIRSPKPGGLPHFSSKNLKKLTARCPRPNRLNMLQALAYSCRVVVRSLLLVCRFAFVDNRGISRQPNPIQIDDLSIDHQFNIDSCPPLTCRPIRIRQV